MWAVIVDIYALFTFETLYKLYIETRGKLTKGVVPFWFFEAIFINRGLTCPQNLLPADPIGNGQETLVSFLQ